MSLQTAEVLGQVMPVSLRLTCGRSFGWSRLDGSLVELISLWQAMEIAKEMHWWEGAGPPRLSQGRPDV